MAEVFMVKDLLVAVVMICKSVFSKFVSCQDEEVVISRRMKCFGFVRSEEGRKLAIYPWRRPGVNNGTV
jgi:hypothetical protein